MAANDVVIVATGYTDAATALRQHGPLDNYFVIDITNSLSVDYMALTIGHSTSAAEEIAKAVPGSAVVKAFNTLFTQVLADGPRSPMEKSPQSSTPAVASEASYKPGSANPDNGSSA